MKIKELPESILYLALEYSERTQGIKKTYLNYNKNRELKYFVPIYKKGSFWNKINNGNFNAYYKSYKNTIEGSKLKHQKLYCLIDGNEANKESSNIENSSRLFYYQESDGGLINIIWASKNSIKSTKQTKQSIQHFVCRNTTRLEKHLFHELTSQILNNGTKKS